MKKLYRRKLNKKGFSLIELIVVIAILAIIAAIAIPRFALIQARSEVKSDAATAAEIVNAARIYVTDNEAVVPGTVTVAMLEGADYMPVGSSNPQSVDGAGVFVLSYAGGLFTVTWTPDNSATILAQTVTENSKYVFK